MFKYLINLNRESLENNCLAQLFLVSILLFGAFHVSYQHDDFLFGETSHEQNCEYCSSAGSPTILSSSELSLSLTFLNQLENDFYLDSFLSSEFYRLSNPRAPPFLNFV